MRLASPHMRCMLMLCSDMAIRSGTARKLGPEDYDSSRKVLTFTTKYENRQALPVPAELAKLLDQCRKREVPFVAQLTREDSVRGHYFKYDRPLSHQQLDLDWKRLKQRAGITRKLTMHDLRRTTVTRVYDATRDIRLAQAILGHKNLSSTVWYLDHHLTKVPVDVLEQARLNSQRLTTETIQ
jgi:integrase